MADSVLLHKEIKLIQDYINLNKDAFDFYEKARNETKSQELSNMFQFFEIFHGKAIERFQHELDIIGVDASERRPRDTFKGVFNQLVGEIESTLKSNPDKVYLNKLEDAESRCLEFVEDFMANQELSSRMRQVLQDEYQEVVKIRNHIHQLKKQVAA